jgi:hypothetical protein
VGRRIFLRPRKRSGETGVASPAPPRLPVVFGPGSDPWGMSGPADLPFTSTVMDTSQLEASLNRAPPGREGYDIVFSHNHPDPPPSNVVNLLTQVLRAMLAGYQVGRDAGRFGGHDLRPAAPRWSVLPAASAKPNRSRRKTGTPSNGTAPPLRGVVRFGLVAAKMPPSALAANL